jgi:uncharacterized membrane protein YGL010W
MTEIDSWLDHYQETHDDLTNPAIYWSGVPLVVLGTVGLLWLLPVPDAFPDISPLFNWGTAFLMVAVVYYFIISVSLAIGMLPFIVGVAATQIWLARSGFPPLVVSIGLLAAGIIALWLGHLRHGVVAPVLRDLQLMMIAPAWMLSVLYRRIGIPY